MARFSDTIIDYPNSKLYFSELVERLEQMEVLTAKKASVYKLHLENIEKEAYDVDNE